MGKQVLTNAMVLVGDYDITGDSNAVAVDYGAELKDCTTFNDDTRINKGGLKTVQVQVSGFYDAATQDSKNFNDVGVAGNEISFAVGQNAGDVAYFFDAVAGEYETGESVGEINKFSLGAGAQGDLIRGVIGHNARLTAETVTGDGSAIQLLSVGVDQKLYAVLHVIESSGTGDQTLDVVIESDSTAGMTSPSTQITFSQVGSSTASESLSQAGAIADNYFRVSYTIAGSGSPSFKFVVFMGVQ